MRDHHPPRLRRILAAYGLATILALVFLAATVETGAPS